MKKKILIFLLAFPLLISNISAFGFSTQTSEDGEFGFPQESVTTDYVINASNHSEYWDTDEGTLDNVADIFLDWISVDDTLTMNGNDISDVGDIFADSVAIWDTTADADGVLSIYTHDASNSFVATVNDAGSTDLYSTDQYQFRSGDDLFQFAEHSYLGTWLNIDVENDNPEFHSESGIVNFTDEDIITTGEIYSIGDLYVGDEMYIDAGTGTIYTTGTMEAETSMSSPVVYTDTIATRSGSSTIFDWDSDLSQIIVHKNLNFTYNDEILGESKYNIVGVGNVSADYGFFDRVGIGTTSPDELAHIKMTYGIPLLLEGTSDVGSTTLQIKNADGGVYFGVQKDGYGWLLTDGTKDLIIGATTASEGHMRIDTSGNVGIGTDSPSTRLHLAPDTSNAGDHAQLLLDDYTANVAGLLLYENNNNGICYIENRYNNDAGDIRFRTKTLGTPVDVLTLEGGGNVGIGTTSPNEKLTINDSTAWIGFISDAIFNYSIGANSVGYSLYDDTNGQYKFTFKDSDGSFNVYNDTIIHGNLNVTTGFTGSCVNVTYSGGIAVSCND